MVIEKSLFERNVFRLSTTMSRPRRLPFAQLPDHVKRALTQTCKVLTATYMAEDSIMTVPMMDNKGGVVWKNILSNKMENIT